MQDIIKPMLSVRDIDKLKINDKQKLFDDFFECEL